MKLRILSIVFAALIVSGCSDSSSTKSGVTTSKETKSSITLTKLNGEKIEAKLSGGGKIKDFKFSNAEGKAVVAVYWSTTCPPCRAEIPHLIKLQDKYKDNIKVLGILVEDKTKVEVEEFVKYHEMNYDILFGKENYDLADLMGGIRGIPAMFIFNKDGSLHKNFVGLLPPEMLEAEIKKVI